MGSLAALRRSSRVTVFLVFLALSLFLLAVLVLVDVALAHSATGLAVVVLVPFALAFILLQWAIAPSIVRRAARLQNLVTAQSNPWLYRTVGELTHQAQVPVPARIWVSDDPTPNAFVFGRTRASCELAVTQGLLLALNQEEVRAVLAHEVGHLRHGDFITLTFASAVPLLAYVFARAGFEALRGGGRGGRGSGKAFLAALLVAVLSYAVYLLTQLLVRHLSRTREYYADAYGAAAVGDPHALASALTKVTYGLSLAGRRDNPTGLRAFMIGDPVRAADDYQVLREKMARFDLDQDGELDLFELEQAVVEELSNPWVRANALFKTHPPTYARVLMLKQLEAEIRLAGMPANAYQYI